MAPLCRGRRKRARGSAFVGAWAAHRHTSEVGSQRLGRRGKTVTAWVWALAFAACAREGPPPTPAPAAVADSQPSVSKDAKAAQKIPQDDEPEPPRAADPRPLPKTWLAEARKKAPAANPADVARAKRLLEKGLLAYRKGDYDRAEEALKQAMTIYPFLAEANLALGKIFLIRGSATLDRALINNARLMFEMAHALDPSLHETDVLLELFRGEEPP